LKKAAAGIILNKTKQKNKETTADRLQEIRKAGAACKYS
jgi:hypothetical protein